ncbi:MAG: PD-(D/E)XK nuclease family protein [Candidatus Nealsonbacteria bacterium]|nr:PD-(D/E)XK nuclease family protein [Candidatus Nealsonbacteria bacterium]
MLKELIDKFYLDREKGKEREQTRFYVTDAGKCARAVFFKFKKAPRGEMEARVLRMFEHGDYIHRLILSTLFSLGLVRASEINVPTQQIISGRADAILTWENELYVLDIKSINSFLFKNLLQPKEENLDQIQLYLHFFNIQKGILLYVNKDTQELKEFVVISDRARAEKLLQDLQALKTKIDGNVIPARLADFPSNKECQFCQFREICGQASANEMSWSEFKKKLSSQRPLL